MSTSEFLVRDPVKERDGVARESTHKEPPSFEGEYSIRYDGGDADQHEIDLSQLGQSLQGFARVLAVCAHFVQTGKYNKQFDSLSVKVYASPVEEHHCYEVVAAIKSIATSKEMWSGFAGVALTLVVNYIFSRRKEEEMKHLSDALKQSLGQNASMSERLLSTIEKMADALRPAAKQAMTPVGGSCKSISIYEPGKSLPSVVLGQDVKDALSLPIDTVIDSAKEYVGVISEMDMETGACRVTLADSESPTRVVAQITDPVGRTASNAYALAMAALKPIRFIAKAELDADGGIVKLHISDIVPTTPA